jgi:hypothetical protein
MGQGPIRRAGFIISALRIACREVPKGEQTNFWRSCTRRARLESEEDNSPGGLEIERRGGFALGVCAIVQ